MTQKLRFPFRLNKAFFSTIRFHRDEVVPDVMSLEFNVQANVFEENFPKSLQLGLKIETQEGQPVDICLELIGLFDLIDGYGEPSNEIIPDFLNERALFILWPYLNQTIRHITAMIGITPIDIKTPYQFNFKQSDKDE